MEVPPVNMTRVVRYVLGAVLLLATALGEEEQQRQQQQQEGLRGPDWAEAMFQDPHRLSPLGEESGRLGMFSADQEVFQTAVRPLIPDVEAKSCLTSLARDHSPFSARVTKKHVPRQYNLLDRKFYYKGNDIPYNYKTPCFDTCALVGSSGVLKNSKCASLPHRVSSPPPLLSTLIFLCDEPAPPSLSPLSIPFPSFSTSTSIAKGPSGSSAAPFMIHQQQHHQQQQL